MNTMQANTGEKVTVIFINGLFQTIKTAVTITGKDKKGYYGYYEGNEEGIGVYIQHHDSLIFKGEEIPLNIYNELYGDGDETFGNAQLNILLNEDEATTKKWIKENNINQKFDEWDRLTFWKSEGKRIHLCQQQHQQMAA